VFLSKDMCYTVRDAVYFVHICNFSAENKRRIGENVKKLRK